MTGKVQFAKSLAVGEGFPRLFEKYAFFPNPKRGFILSVKLKVVFPILLEGYYKILHP